MNQRPLFLFIAGLFLALIGVSLFRNAGRLQQAGPGPADVDRMNNSGYLGLGLLALAAVLVVAAVVLQRKEPQ